MTVRIQPSAEPRVAATPAITFFSIPKPFVGRFKVLQYNAIGSWLNAVPGSEVLLCGEEEGLRAAAGSFGARALPEVTRNALGTPLLDSAFAEAYRHARGNCLCYVNTDIVVCSDLAKAAQSVRRKRFLLAARRGELDGEGAIDFHRDDWRERVTRNAVAAPEGADPFAIDLFLFPRRREFCELPPFAVGRPGWDNWYLYMALSRGAPVIDATDDVRIYHQRHGYAHVPGNRGGAWEGPEADANRALAGGWSNLLSIQDASHRLAAGRMRVEASADSLDRRVERLRQYRPALYRGLVSWKLRRLFCRVFPLAAFGGAKEFVA